MGAEVRIGGGDAGGATVKCLELVRACRLALDDPIIAVGEVDTHFLTSLLMAGYRDLTVLSGSAEALEEVRTALRHFDQELALIHGDVLQFKSRRRFALWHDRGLFHCLTHPEDRQRYVEVVEQALRPEGCLVICAFGPDGPHHYGGMPVARYSASGLAEHLGPQFELAEHGLAVHEMAEGHTQQLLHCRFRRHAPRWTR